MSLADLFYRAAHGLDLARLARQSHRDRVAVLMYHGVADDGETLTQGDWLQLRVSEFREQMAYLATHYQVCRIDEVLASAPTASAKPRALITFDDGYANNLHHALPVLREFGLPATIFLVTGHVDTKRLFWWDRLHLACLGGPQPDPRQVQALKDRNPRDIKAAVDAYLAAKRLNAPEIAPEPYRVLNREEIAALSASGLIEFGSHTHGHEILENLDDHEVSATLEVAAEKLSKWGLTARHFAAPNGDYLDTQIGLIQAAGHASCFATHSGLWQAPGNPYRVPRLGIGRGTKLDRFAMQISGFKRWIQGRAGGVE